MTAPGKGSVLLFRPVADPVSRRGGCWIPYALLALGDAVREAGFPVSLADGYHDGTPAEILDRQGPDLCLVGITAASGHQAKEGLAFARSVRERFPRARIVWGGPQEVEDPSVDTVIRGPGEGALMALLGRPREACALPRRPYRFDLLPLARYVTRRPGLPGLRIISFFPGEMDPGVAAQNARELLEASGANTLYVAEEAFFSRPDHVQAFCTELKRLAPWACWIADARAQDLEGRPVRFWDLLAGTGLVLLRIGLEPGPAASDGLLKASARRGILVECAVHQNGPFGGAVEYLRRVMRANPANKILVLRSRGEAPSARLAFLQRVHHYAWLTEEMKLAYARKGRPAAAFYVNHLLARLRWRFRFFAFPVEHWLGESGLNRLIERPLARGGF